MDETEQPAAVFVVIAVRSAYEEELARVPTGPEVVGLTSSGDEVVFVDLGAVERQIGAGGDGVDVSVR